MAYTAADPNLYGPQPAAPPPQPPHHHHYDPSAAAPPYHHPPPHHQPYSAYYPNPSPVVPHENPSPATDPGGYAYPHYVYPPPEGYAGYPPPPTPAYSYPPPGAAGAPARAPAPYYYGPPGGVEGPPGVHPLSYPQPMMMGTGQKKTSEDLETKKRKLIKAGTAADSVRICSPCNIVCNSDVSFAAHLAGEKHAQKMLMGTGQMKTTEDLETKKRKLIAGGTAADSVRICAPCNIVCNSDVAFAAHLAGEKHAQKVFGQSSNGTNGLMPVIPTHIKPHKKAKVIGQDMKKNAKVVQSEYCEVCKLEGSSHDIFNHKIGKKHAKNLLKLQESIVSKPVHNPSTTDTEIPNKVKPIGKKKKKTGEDLETKKRRMLDAGADADAVRVCTVCNVVCNSQAVFVSHLVGHKHISMVKQQQQPKPAN